MLKFIKAIICIAAVFSLCFTAVAVSEQESRTEHNILFAAYCENAADVLTALSADADYITLGGELQLEEADSLVNGEAAIIIDADSIEMADELYGTILSMSPVSEVYLRIKESAGKTIKWAQSKEELPLLIGSYTGNIYFSALSCINRFGKYEACDTVQLQTGNQDGVILHNTVTFMFNKADCKGMFSFANEKSAARTDSARSWDDLISKGYSVIETAYPEDFAEYLAQNTAEREKLAYCVEQALKTDTQGCKPNRISVYEEALSTAQALLEDGSSANYMLADARAELDEAVEKIGIDDGSKVKGDFRITPARAAWALFGVALVLSWQIYFRKHWGKKQG